MTAILYFILATMFGTTTYVMATHPYYPEETLPAGVTLMTHAGLFAWFLHAASEVM